MKLNNKGFAITIVLYGTLVLFLLLIVSLLGILSTYKLRLEKVTDNTEEIIHSNKNCTWKKICDVWTSQNIRYCSNKITDDYISSRCSISTVPPKCNPDGEDLDPNNHVSGYLCRKCHDQSYKVVYPSGGVSGTYKYSWNLSSQCLKAGYDADECSLRQGSGTQIYEYQCS